MHFFWKMFVGSRAAQVLRGGRLGREVHKQVHRGGCETLGELLCSSCRR